MQSTAPNDAKVMAIGAVLQVFSSLLGMTDEDFQDLSHQIGEMYSGPLPDQYSEEVINFYKEFKNHE